MKKTILHLPVVIVPAFSVMPASHDLFLPEIFTTHAGESLYETLNGKENIPSAKPYGPYMFKHSL